MFGGCAHFYPGLAGRAHFYPALAGYRALIVFHGDAGDAQCAIQCTYVFTKMIRSVKWGGHIIDDAFGRYRTSNERFGCRGTFSVMTECEINKTYNTESARGSFISV